MNVMPTCNCEPCPAIRVSASWDTPCALTAPTSRLCAHFKRKRLKGWSWCTTLHGFKQLFKHNAVLLGSRTSTVHSVSRLFCPQKNKTSVVLTEIAETNCGNCSTHNDPGFCVDTTGNQEHRMRQLNLLTWRVYCIIACVRACACIPYIPYYFEYKTCILHIFPHWKIEVHLKFEECTSFSFPPALKTTFKNRMRLEFEGLLQSK
jgi:hypothetical protein